MVGAGWVFGVSWSFGARGAGGGMYCLDLGIVDLVDRVSFLMFEWKELCNGASGTKSV